MKASMSAPPVAKKAANGSMAGAKRIGPNPTRRTNGGGPNRENCGPKGSPVLAK